MLGSIIGAGVGAAASILAAFSASKAIKKMKANLEAQRKKNTGLVMTNDIMRMQHSVQTHSVSLQKQRRLFETATEQHREQLP